MVLFGNDVSSHNELNNIGLNALDYSIVKLTEGASYINPKAYTQSKATQEAGKLLGYYHWLSAGVNVIDQANYFLITLGQDAIADDIILMLDVEEEALTGDEPKIFMDYVFQKTGKRMLVYMGVSYINNPKYDWSDIADTYPVMVAGYPLNDGSGYTSELQAYADTHYFNGLKWWSIVTAWQYTSVPFDHSVFYGDRDTWHAIGSRVNAGEKPASLDKTKEINALAKKIVDLTNS